MTWLTLVARRQGRGRGEGRGPGRQSLDGGSVECGQDAVQNVALYVRRGSSKPKSLIQKPVKKFYYG